ncbi:Leucine-rich repeat-containing protein [Cynara cardunculus var. scolymus]|uniref:Leucine-rich repeat-containing protein n=1 Tax=Cynara cardunculus var. scolymus TaxID=59895 RepID=A0A118K2I6_CYNCS|nr:Leucine-rich repeat-containing protein [Cynara cardunculus var. scolymus]
MKTTAIGPVWSAITPPVMSSRFAFVDLTMELTAIAMDLMILMLNLKKYQNKLGGIISPSLINLKQLRYLDLSCNNFGSSKIPTFIGYFQNLSYLNVSKSQFYGEIPHHHGNLSMLQVLALQGDPVFRNLYSKSLKWLKNLKRLKHLDMSGVDLVRASDWLQNLSLIVHIELSNNENVEKIPKSLSNLCNLITLDLQSNEFHGDVSELLKNFCEWTIPESLGSLSFLKTLEMNINQLVGSIPNMVGGLSSLNFLDLSYNKLNGSLPESIGQLGKLTFASLHHNSLTGIVTEHHFANLSALKTLWVRDNKLVFKLSVTNWILPFQLDVLRIGSSSLGPSKLGDVRFLTPGAKLDLSANHFYGLLPYNLSRPDLEFLDLSYNNLFGSLIQFLCSIIQEPCQLKVLVLGNNNLSGVISNCWINWGSLEILDLQENKLSGEIPSSIGNISSLVSLAVHNNRPSKKLRVSLSNSKSLVIIELAENRLSRRIPTSIGGDDTSLRLLSLHSNKLEGEILNEICRISSLQILDLAHNDLFGNLPTCFRNFSVIS